MLEVSLEDVEMLVLLPHTPFTVQLAFAVRLANYRQPPSPNKKNPQPNEKAKKQNARSFLFDSRRVIVCFSTCLNPLVR